LKYFINKTPESIATTGIFRKFEVTTNQITMTNLQNPEQEIWIDIKGFESIYQISTLGNVRGLERTIDSSNQWGLYKRKISAKKLVNVLHKNGYFRIDLSGKLYSIHRLVAISFIPNSHNLPEVNHKNGIKTDNRLENLEWCSKSQNIRHADLSGLRIMPKGKDHYMFNRTGAKHHGSKKVVCISTGKVYDSIKIASNVAGIKYKYFSIMLSGKANNKTNFKYK
jgi:hypothetical protein